MGKKLNSIGLIRESFTQFHMKLRNLRVQAVIELMSRHF